MPRVPTLPDFQRFFARIEKFHMECPRCAYLILGQKRLRDATTYRRLGAWNHITGRLHCPQCSFKLAVGLLAYPLAHATRSAGARPADQKPTWQELLKLRELSGGHYIGGEAKTPWDHANLYVEAECTCDPDQRRLCPVHGRHIED